MPQPIKTLASSINSSHADIKAEVIIADLMDKGVGLDQIVAVLQGAFSRNYSRDLKSASADMVHELLYLTVSRDGFYDLLPEGLFHDLVNYSSMDRDQRKIEFKKQKHAEDSARKFFLPADNEFIAHRAKSELRMLQFVRDPFTGMKRLTLEEPSIPEKYYRSFISLIPFAPDIKGHAGKTVLALEEILKNKVTLESCRKQLSFRIPETAFNGSSARALGEELLCSDGFNESVVCWEFTIHLRDEAFLEDFTRMETGALDRIMDRFCSIFVPFEIHVETKTICHTGHSFILGEEAGPGQQAGFLGFNQVL